MSDLDWKEVPQGRRVSARLVAGARLALRQRSGETLLTLTISETLRAHLNWWPGDRLGFAVGQGSMVGFLRFFKQLPGRKLSAVNAEPLLLLSRFSAPSEWKDLRGELDIEALSYRNGELLIQVAAIHDHLFGETVAGTGTAGHEVAA